MDVLVLSRAEVERLLDPGAMLEALRDAFRALSDGRVTAPGRNALPVPGGDVLLGMPGRIGSGRLIVKVVTVFDGNAALGIPTHLATIAIHDDRTGACLAFMDGTAITALRTSAAAAIACDLAARRDARVLAIVGGGVQAAHHLLTLPLVRDFAEIRVTALRAADAQAVAAGHPRARVVADAEDAVRDADVIALTTSAPEPVIRPEWVAPGAHVSSIGYHPPAGELPRELARDGRLLVETRDAFAPPPVGCAELQGIDPGRGTELGEILLGRRPGRTDDAEITVYKAMGHVAEDAAGAELVYAAALVAGAGHVVEL